MVLIGMCVGFTVVQWWASVGIVSCYWLSGNDSSAECYYANIEALSGEMGAAVPSALQLAFKANRLYKRPDSNNSKKVPVQLVLQLCATTSNSLKSSVANLLQDQSNSTEVELHQVSTVQFSPYPEPYFFFLLLLLVAVGAAPSL